MKKILVTGGTVFVSRYIAEYYVAKGCDVYVLNRNSKEQSKGVTLIEADRHNLGEILREHRFDTVIDTAYSNGDFDLIYPNAQCFHKNGTNNYGYFFFDDEQFDALISGYVSE